MKELFRQAQNNVKEFNSFNNEKKIKDTEKLIKEKIDFASAIIIRNSKAGMTSCSFVLEDVGAKIARIVSGHFIAEGFFVIESYYREYNKLIYKITIDWSRNIDNVNNNLSNNLLNTRFFNTV